ncbi:MAG: hypothetical protein ACE5KV_08825 [Thermoplasmata archaeon]
MRISPVFQITEKNPTPLLKDFGTFISYLEEHRVSLTRMRQHIPGKDLHNLNRQMAHPVLEATAKSPQRLYPLLHLFYHLVLAGKLFRKVVGKARRSVLELTDRLQFYEELKPAERYFFLLETFWVDIDWEKLAVGYLGDRVVYSIPYVLEYLSE